MCVWVLFCFGFVGFFLVHIQGASLERKEVLSDSYFFWQTESYRHRAHLNHFKCQFVDLFSLNSHKNPSKVLMC